MPDVIVGRFALIDLIARGGSGSVWRAWDRKARRLCAVKVLRQRDSADLLRFVRETGVTFDHPHLLAPYGWGAEDEHVVIAMPLVSGGTLESVVQREGPFAEPAVAVILDQLLDGLGHMHERGWIHRDVKPANLMFEVSGSGDWPQARLADFGIAVSDQDVRLTHVGMVNGTPGYMAPELFAMAEPHPSHDLYAAGMLALFALNGSLPLRDAPLRADEVARYLHGVAPQLAAVIRRLIDPQPGRRYQDAPTARRDMPRVDPGYPLQHRSGAPVLMRDTLAPLPDGAPGADGQAQEESLLAAAHRGAARHEAAAPVPSGQPAVGDRPTTGGDGPTTGGDGPTAGGDGPTAGGDRPTTGEEAPVLRRVAAEPEAAGPEVAGRLAEEPLAAERPRSAPAQDSAPPSARNGGSPAEPDAPARAEHESAPMVPLQESGVSTDPMPAESTTLRAAPVVQAQARAQAVQDALRPGSSAAPLDPARFAPSSASAPTAGHSPGHGYPSAVQAHSSAQPHPSASVPPSSRDPHQDGSAPSRAGGSHLVRAGLIGAGAGAAIGVPLLAVLLLLI
ncbi:protein kinase [Brachybacterium sp. JHP9]|uniref:non-specific serine/threonine protein kinase n=1 Tax=Brachybacterium equifaecis TaxID=2910770 RepID=A0ABT0QZW5_9MICO|nr:serine/threonine-protein kinase [Brachybacterium equifaecis]MCL6423196.1 protein kinase [Brachybacterium equifaecis]